MIDKNRMYENLKRLVSVPSISGTSDEEAGAEKIQELLMEIPYFQKHPDQVMLLPIEGDPFDRKLITAFLEAPEKTKDTVILTGHYDVVDVEEFGSLKDIAFNVDEITDRIKELPLSDEVLNDYMSGNYLFGRGVLDMKYGHVASLELLHHYSETQSLKGNLLYVGVCGEETNSEGMLAAVKFFNSFRKEKGLKYRLMLLMEGYLVDGQEAGVRYIQYGNAGKVMPMFFCIGKTTHGEEPLLGLDANSLSSEVYRLMHTNPLFCQNNHGITTSPPCGLKLQDMKENYSLSTTLYAASYYNIATIKLDPEDLMNKLKGIANEAFDNVIEIIKKNVDRFTKLAERVPDHYMPEPKVQTFAEFYEDVKNDFDGDLATIVKEKLAEFMSVNPEMQDSCVQLVKYLAGISKDKTPRIIISIIPPYYPDVNLNMEDPDTVKMMENMQDIIKYAADNYGETLKTSEYYGISDMSYTWLADGLDFDALFENLIGVGSIYQFPGEDLKEFKVPGMVLGCAGKDMHKYTERLEKHYNFEVLPNLYIRAIENIIG